MFFINRQIWVLRIFIVVLVLLCGLAKAEEKKLSSACTLQLSITGTIGPGSYDFLERAYERARKKKCSSVLALINTPGGSLQSTRSMVELILNSELPFLCLVYPSGGHAGSAGAIILQACHVNGAVSATNLGAATPILSTGGETPKDLRQKLINDNKSWLIGIAKLRNRNIKFSEEIITKAKSLSAEEALKQNAIDFNPVDIPEFLKQSQGRQVKMESQALHEVEVGPVIVFEQDLRYQALSLLTDPQVAYMMFMGSLGLLYFEMTHPGVIVPGVVGGIGLVVALISLYNLQVEWAGLLLICLGLIFLVLEAFVPSFGVLGLGGVVAFVLGSLFLFDFESTGIRLPLAMVLTTALFLGGVMVGIAYLAFSSRHLKPYSGEERMRGLLVKVAEVSKESSCEGHVFLKGELWKFRCDTEVKLNDSLKIDRVEGLSLIVKKEV